MAILSALFIASFNFLSFHVEFCWNIAFTELWAITTGLFGFAFHRNTDQFQLLEQDANPYDHTIVSKYFLEIMGRRIIHLVEILAWKMTASHRIFWQFRPRPIRSTHWQLKVFFNTGALLRWRSYYPVPPIAATHRHLLLPTDKDHTTYTQTSARNSHTHQPCTRFSLNSWPLLTISLLPAGCQMRLFICTKGLLFCFLFKPFLGKSSVLVMQRFLVHLYVLQWTKT